MKLDLEKLERQLRDTRAAPPKKKEDEKETPPPKTPVKYVARNIAKQYLFPALDVLVLLLLPLMIIRPAYAKIIPFARSDAALGWKFYVLLFFIIIIHLAVRHWLNFLEPPGRYFRYLHFPIRNYFDIRPIRWLFTIEVIFVFYVYFKILTL